LDLSNYAPGFDVVDTVLADIADRLAEGIRTQHGAFKCISEVRIISCYDAPKGTKNNYLGIEVKLVRT